MKIVYLGNTKLSWCTECDITRTLKRLGHEIVNLQEDEVSLNQVLEQTKSSDMFLWTRTPDFLKFDGWEMLCKIKIPKVSYHLDLYCGISREPMLETDPFFHTDIVFQPDGDPESLEKFKLAGTNVYWMPPAISEDYCYIAPPKDILASDVVFVGSKIYHEEWTHRPRVIEFLRNTYRGQFRLYPGDKYQAKMGHELNDLLSSVKVSVGDSLCMGYTHRNYWSNRVVEQTGRGGFLLFPHVPGLEQFFEDKKHLVFYEYDQFDHLKELIDHYLAHEDERNVIRKAGYENTKANHTLLHRFRQVFRVLAEQEII